MNLLFITIVLLILVGVVFVVWILFGIVRCAEAQEESHDGVTGTGNGPGIDSADRKSNR